MVVSGAIATEPTSLVRNGCWLPTEFTTAFVVARRRWDDATLHSLQSRRLLVDRAPLAQPLVADLRGVALRQRFLLLELAVCLALLARTAMVALAVAHLPVTFD